MLTAACALLITIALLVHFFLVERPRRAQRFREEEERARSRPPPPPPSSVSESQAVAGMPGGLFLQSTFTWTRLLDEGDVVLGLHPLLLGLVGAPLTLTLREPGDEIVEGEALLGIQKEGRGLQVSAPFDGTVVETNQETVPEAGWRGVGTGGRNWIYRIRPHHPDREVPRWLLGSAAKEWTREEYREIRDYLLDRLPERRLGDAVTEEGELPLGVLTELDLSDWKVFQRRFLPPREPRREA